MLEIVAVGAIAIVFELRMPVFFTRLRKASQSSRPLSEIDLHAPDARPRAA
jgi:hypothetical protein